MKWLFCFIIIRMKYFIGGINGSGKSNFITNLKDVRPNYETVDGSKDFMKWLGFDGDYDRLRKLMPEIRDSKLAEFISQTLNKSEAETLVYVGHYIVLVKGEIINVTRDWLARFDGIVLITARPEVILKRINDDAHDRDRALFKEGTTDQEAMKILKDYQLKEHVAFLDLADRYGIPGLVMDNSESVVANVVFKFLEFDAKIRRSYL